MFPNPQDVLPQPPNPNVQQYRKLAKDLVKACRTGSSDGIRDWTSGFVQHLVQLSRLEISPNLPVEVSRWIDQVTEFATKTLLQGERKCTLTTAQFIIARSLGFTSWPRFTKHLEEMEHRTSAVSEFEAAARSVFGKKQKQRQRQKQPRRSSEVDTVTPYQAKSLIDLALCTESRIGPRKRPWQR
jgi:hypothetical protein